MLSTPEVLNGCDKEYVCYICEQGKAPTRSWSPVSMLDKIHDSREEAKKLFECMLYPVQVDRFFR